jgi:hypothetical protein
MAVIISNGATNLSTASGFYRVEAHNLASFSATDLALTSTRTISVTFANAGNCQGIVLVLSNVSVTAHTTYKSVTVELLEGVTVRATATLTGSQITNSIASFAQADGFIVPFTFGTPYAVTTAASTWSFRITQSGAQAQNWSIRTSNAAAPFYATWCDNAVTFASGDTIICKDPVTVDQTTTIGSVLGTGDSTNGVAIVICKSSNGPTPSNTEGNLLWDATASYTLSVGGVIVLGAHSAMRVGSSASRVSYANQAHIQFTSPTVGTVAGAFCSTEGPNSNGTRSKLSLFFYGDYPTVEDCELSADTTVNGTTFTSTTNASSWQNGWRVAVSKQNVKGTGDTAVYVLSGAPSWSGSATTFTTTAGLATNVRKSGGKIFTLDGYGIKISTNNTTFRWRFYAAHPSNFVLSGVQMEEFTVGDNSVTQNTANTYSLDDAANLAQHVIEHCSMYSTVGNSNGHIGTHTAPPAGMLIDHVNSFRTIPFSSPTYSSVANGSFTYTNCIASMLPAFFTPILMFSNSTTSGNVWENSASNFLASSGNTTNSTFTNNEFWGHSGVSGFNVQNLFNCTLSGNTYNNSAVGMTFAGIVLGCIDTNSQFGNETANTVDLTYSSLGLIGYKFVSPTGSLIVTESTLTGTINGSTTRIAEFNDTTNDYRAYYTYGKFINSSSNLEIYPYSGSAEVVASYKVGTENISTFKIGVFSSFTIADTAYDAGTYILPKLSFVYDTAGTESTTQAAASFGSAQALSVIVTPTNDRATSYVKYKAASDATSPNNKVTVTPAVINLRKYGYVFQSATLSIKETTDETVALLTTPASNPYITEATAATVAAYTEFTINHATQTVTITADTTLDRLYDYAQYNLTLDANMGYAEWLTTLDGTNYTSTYNVTLNTGVDLTGGGSINVGALTFTRTGTATYDGIVITSTNRVVHIKLTGLIAGSVVQVYNTTNSAEIDKATVSGTTYDYYYTYTADKAIRVRVRYVSGTTGYLPYEVTGTIANTGFNAVVAQESADIYNGNNFDGSTATEFSMTEGVIKIYVDDPNNSTTGQRMYNWYLHTISSSTYIDDQADLVTAQTAWSYVLDDTLTIKNLDLSNPLFITGANINNETGDGQVIDTAGGSININGYFPFNSASDVREAVKALTLGQFLALK